MAYPTHRLRRLRHLPYVRDLVRENRLHVHDFIQPLFIHHGNNLKNPISTMPGCFQWSVDQLEPEIVELSEAGIRGVLLFGIPATKDSVGSDACHDGGIIAEAIRQIKSINSDLLVIPDVCCCEYMDHGHCGVINDKTGQMDVDNDATLEVIAKQSLNFVSAGADIIAPSGNMDGMVQAIRKALDKDNFTHVPILSYAVKYASALYGPFRVAAGDSQPSFGDRQSYQMDPANSDEALREIQTDIEEGADILMVKPASIYSDILYKAKQAFPHMPISAYHVGGEYAMIKAAAQNGWIDERKVTLETMLGLKRAGADFIITYHAKDIAGWLNQEASS